ncbi:MAG: ATP synthase F1 subunit gamma [Erysipelotrichia bacterium]|nr:ATP synthase F1 subunit gamma [Erysipelotrichia bacterium]
MAGQISSIKRQLRSVISTKKLTNAMELVATAKLQKLKKRMEQNNHYADYYRQMLFTVCSSDVFKEDESIYFHQSEKNALHIISTSDSGLCGSYNLELLKYAEKTLNKNDPILSVGSYGTKWLKTNGYNVVNEFEHFDDLLPSEVNRLIADVLKMYKNEQIGRVDIIYTQYINTLNYKPTVLNLLPLNGEMFKEKRAILLEPDCASVLEQLIPMYISSQVYAAFLQAKTSEQASRRAAMDNANRNADELIDELRLSFNQARQAAITQEMNEITAGTIREKKGAYDD